jgi:hypothetical protein
MMWGLPKELGKLLLQHSGAFFSLNEPVKRNKIWIRVLDEFLCIRWIFVYRLLSVWSTMINSKLKYKLKHKAVDDLTNAFPMIPLSGRSNLAGWSLSKCATNRKKIKFNFNWTSNRCLNLHSAFQKEYTTQKRRVEWTVSEFPRIIKKLPKLSYSVQYFTEHVPLFNLTLIKTEN